MRRGRQARDFDAARGQQRALMADLAGGPSPCGGLGGVGDAYGGDAARRGVLGDGFPRSRSLGAAA